MVLGRKFQGKKILNEWKTEDRVIRKRVKARCPPRVLELSNPVSFPPSHTAYPVPWRAAGFSDG